MIFQGPFEKTLRRDTEIFLEKILDLDIIYEDQYLMVVKTSHQVWWVHPCSRENWTGTLVNGLGFIISKNLPEMKGNEGPDLGWFIGITKETSGLLVIAQIKNSDGLIWPPQFFSSIRFERTYMALVWES